MRSADAIKADFACGELVQKPSVANPPNKRLYACSARVGDRLYYFGGSGSNELWSYDISDKLWRLTH